MSVPTSSGASAPAAFAADDAVLDQVVEGVCAQVDAAQRERGQPGSEGHSREMLRERALALIDLPDQKRVLWVDDRPAGNRFEAAALNKLQIEVVTALSTDEALRRIAEDREPFDLVISDWERPHEGEGAGLALLERLRAGGHAVPLIYYHGAYGSAVQRVLRVARATQAKLKGAAGEAVMPDELLALALKVLAA